MRGGGSYMDKQSIESIQLELAIFVRYITSVTPDKKKNGIDRSGYLLLHQISQHGSTSVKALAHEYHLDISTVSRQAASLESKGCIYKIPNPVDKRSYSYEITPLGKKILQDYKQEQVEKLELLFEDWTEEECQQFSMLLKKFNNIFDS